MSADLSEQHRAAREGALLVLQPDLGCLRIVGPDRKSWLNGIVTCDVLTISSERGAFGLALSKHGKILSDLAIVEKDDTLFVSTASGVAHSLFQHLDGMLVMEDAELENVSDAFQWFHLHGPRSMECAKAVVGGVSGRIDWTGLGGAALVVPRSGSEDARQALVAAGVVVADDAGWQGVRLERALPWFGVDYTSDDNPHQASLDQRAVNWSKGCYLGQEVVCMQGMRGKVKRRLSVVTLDGDDVPARGTPVKTPDGAVAGEVTSAAQSASLGHAIAMARLTAPWTEAGAELRVGAQVARVRAEPA